MKLAVASLLFIGASLAVHADGLPGQSEAQASYNTPYAYSEAISNNPALIADFSENPRAISNYHNWSLTPYADWQDFAKIQNLDSTWGPYYRPFEAPAGALSQSTAWFQQRVVAAASVLRNTVPYAHHHISVWDVPNTTEWTDAGYTPGYGIDCSDFTHFAYNYALGIQLKTGVVEQSEMTSAIMHLSGGTQIELQAQRLFDVQNGYTKTFEDLTSQLQPGDLLYIRSDPALGNPISHVILWMGDLAYDTTLVNPDAFLVMDSHGDAVTDSNGNVIPSGPELRPFREGEYYFGSFDHVIRYLPVQPIPEPSTVALLGSGVLLWGFRRWRKRV